jgi:hypothetical protein
MPFGVELPENFSSPAESTSDATAPESNLASERNTETREPESKPIELDSLQSFRYKGKDYTQKDVEALLARESEPRQSGDSQSYSRQDFEANYASDLAAVRNDPARLGEFAAIYPREYVVRAIAEINQQKSESSSRPNVGDLPKEYLDRFDKYDRLFASVEQAAQDHQVATQMAQLDSWHSKLEKKFPDADPKVVDSLALALNEKGFKIDEKLMEKLYKRDHEERESYYAKKYRQKAEAQLSTNKRSRDIAPGGEPLGSGKAAPKTIKQATALAIESLGRR